MRSNQGQPEDGPVVLTADETQHEVQAPASEHQPTTTTVQKPQVERPKVAGVDDYQQELDAALSAEPESEQGEPAEEEDGPEHPEDVETPTEEQQTEEATEETTDEPDPDAEPTTTEETTPPLPKDFRPRLNSLDDHAKEAIALVKSLADKGEKISLSEAERRVNAKYGVEVEKPTPTEEAAPTRTSDQVKTEIADLKVQRKEAIRGLDPEKQIELEEKIEKLEDEQAELVRSEADRVSRKQSEEDAAFDRAVKTDRAFAETVYPAMKDANHAIHAEAARIWAVMEKTNNPLIYSEQANSQVYTMAANKLGIAPVDPDAAPAAPAKPVVAPAKKSSPSATPKPQAVVQQAVRRQSAVTPATGGDRTTQPGPADDRISKIGSVHDYDRFVQDL